MSLNDVLTIIVATAAVGASLLALWINDSVDKRSARSALTELTVRVNQKAAVYERIRNADKQYKALLELTVLLRQADELVDRLGRHFPESVGITLAQALELLGNSWWADRYWALAATTPDPYFRVYTVSYWANALWARGEHEAAWAKMDEVPALLKDRSPYGRLVRGDNYLAMGKLVASEPPDDARPASHWFNLARQEYDGLSAQQLGSGRTLPEETLTSLAGQTGEDTEPATAGTVPPGDTSGRVAEAANDSPQDDGQ